LKKAKYYEDDVRKWKQMDKSTMSHILTLLDSGIKYIKIICI